ncbi:enkurin isoform X2 [Gouania willdenowi]|nr:enkurin-like isoform X2 [Gouania willdenowi]
MGAAEVEIPSTDKYLKRRSKEPKLSEISQISKGLHRHCLTERKPAVPKRSEAPLMGFHREKNLLKSTSAPPVKPQPVCVDSHTGHRKVLENLGLVPKYTHKKDYGEVPEYLQRRHEAQLRAQEEYDNFIRQHKEEMAMTHLTEEERRATLEGLKKQWGGLLQEYQGLPLVIDTMSEKNHKVRLEAAMDQLEKDINLLERFKTIYIPKY